jgi:hypothetical protein
VERSERAWRCGAELVLLDMGLCRGWCGVLGVAVTCGRHRWHMLVDSGHMSLIWTLSSLHFDSAIAPFNLQDGCSDRRRGLQEEGLREACVAATSSIDTYSDQAPRPASPPRITYPGGPRGHETSGGQSNDLRSTWLDRRAAGLLCLCDTDKTSMSEPNRNLTVKASSYSYYSVIVHLCLLQDR